MGPYRRYLITGDNVSRSTLSMRRRRAEQRQLRIANVFAANEKKQLGCNIQTALTSKLLQETEKVADQDEPLLTNCQIPELHSNDTNEVCNISECVEQQKSTEMRCDHANHQLNPIESDGSKSVLDPNQSESENPTKQSSSQLACGVNITEETRRTDVSSEEEVESSMGDEDTNLDRQHLSDSDDVHEELSDDDTVDRLKLWSSKLCRCRDTTVGDIIFMCLVLGLRHNLTWDAQIDILKMVSSIFGTGCEIPTNKRAYFNIIQSKSQNIRYHVFCPTCEINLGVKDETHSFKVCPQCKIQINGSNPSNFFVSLSLEAQLKALLRDPHVKNLLLTHRTNRKKEAEDSYEDIYDGHEYKKHCAAGGILSSPYNFSYSFFTDGIKTGQSTGKTMWPIYITLNELPYKERSKYVLLAGLYIGQKDPNPLVFFEPFVEEANKLSSAGFSWWQNGQQVNSKVIPLCAVVDSVARWQLLNMQSFHAYFGCTFCYQQQERTAPNKRRFNILSEKADERTAESTYDDAVIAYERRSEPRAEDRQHRGVKGPSALIGLLYFNLIWGFVVDYMHAILLGVIKTHMENLFESTRKKFWIDANDRVGLEHIMKSIDERLLRIKPPTSITRTPRSISMYKMWKASEWRSWLLFYCVPCLEGLLKEKHLVHLAFLSKGTCLLLQKSVKLADVNAAHSLYLSYCYYFQKYFNIQHTIYNIHLLTHISKCVLNWGPLWTHNAFCYEGQNRHLLQLYKSPNNVVLQIARKFLVFSSIPSLFNKLVSTPDTIEFSEDLLDRKLSRFTRCGQCILTGKLPSGSLTIEEEQFLMMHNEIGKASSCSFFQKVLYNGMRFTSSEYAKGKNNNDSYVVCKNGNVVAISCVVLLQTQAVVLLGHRVAVKRQNIISDHRVSIEHIQRVKRLRGIVCLPMSDIKCQCIFMQTNETTMFISPMPYGCYGD